MSKPTLRIIATLLVHGQAIASHEMVDPQGVFKELVDIVWC